MCTVPGNDKVWLLGYRGHSRADAMKKAADDDLSPSGDSADISAFNQCSGNKARCSDLHYI